MQYTLRQDTKVGGATWQQCFHPACSNRLVALVTTLIATLVIGQGSLDQHFTMGMASGCDH